MNRFFKFLNERRAKMIREAGRPGRGGEGWGSSSDSGSELDRAADLENERRAEVMAKRAEREAQQAKERAKKQAETEAENRRIERGLKEYGFYHYFNQNK
jgi:hypothetical protein